MIELAAATWKLDLTATVGKLQECGLPLPPASTTHDALTNYHRDHIAFRRRVAGFWRDSREYARNNEEVVRNLFRAFDLPPITNDWLARGSNFFGISSYEMLVQYVFGDRREKVSPSDIRRTCKLAQHAFRGTGWAHVLVLPFYNLPGRICGMLLYGLDDEKQPVPAFFPIITLFDRANPDAGLAMVNNMALPPHPHYGDTVFAVAAPLVALRLQLATMRASSLPLPLVATFSGHNAISSDVWQNFRHRRVVCWSPTGHPEAIQQAHRSGGKVSLYQLASRDLEPQAIKDTLQRVCSHAVNWQAALRRRLTTAGQPETETVLQCVRLPDEDLRQFAQGSEPALQKRLEDIRQHVGAVRTVKFGNQTICEQEEKWIIEGGAVLCTAIVRIEQAITSSKQQTYYRGHIHFQKKKIPFLQKAEIIERQGFEWLVRYVRDELGAGVIYYAHGHARKLHNLAILFHTPEQVTGIERLGWDTERRCFHFPGFAISETGIAETSGDTLFSGPTVPGKGLVKPEERLPVRCLQQLSAQHDESGLLWATAAAVVSNLIAPAIHRDPKGILLDGPGAQAIGEAVATRMGCPELLYESGERVTDMLQTQLNQHQWPVVLRAPAHRTLSPGRWLGVPEAARIIVSLPSTTVQVLGLRRQWHIIHCPRRLGSLQLTGDSASLLLPHYLQDLCGRKFARDEERIGSPLEVLADMADWFAEYGGHRAAVTGAKQFLEQSDANTSLHRFFVRLIAYGVAENYIRPARDSCVSIADVLYLEASNTVWISQRSVSDFALRNGDLPLDVLLVTQVLESLGALRAEDFHHGERGWVVDREWWDTQWRSLAHKE
jgi:hypothetical protein